MTDINYISLQKATKYCNYSQGYLSLRARSGKLKSLKFGRNWFTTREWLEEYIKKNEEYNNNLINKEKNEEQAGKPIVILKKEEKSPENLPIEKITTLRFGFIAALVFILLISSLFFGKENFRYVFKNIQPSVQKFSQDFEKELDLLATPDGCSFFTADLQSMFKDSSQNISKNLKSGYVILSEFLDFLKEQIFKIKTLVFDFFSSL